MVNQSFQIIRLALGHDCSLLATVSKLYYILFYPHWNKKTCTASVHFTAYICCYDMFPLGVWGHANFQPNPHIHSTTQLKHVLMIIIAAVLRELQSKLQGKSCKHYFINHVAINTAPQRSFGLHRTLWLFASSKNNQPQHFWCNLRFFQLDSHIISARITVSWKMTIG